jgi:DNA-binding IclR family transcriptional regulator
MPAKNHIELVAKTLAVLESLAANEHGKTLKEIAADVEQVKSSVFRILFTLKESGYVEQADPNGNYRLTLKTGGLTRRQSERPRLIDLARPHLIQLRNELDESVALAERRPKSVVLVDVLETSHPLRLSFQIGDDCPIHATALGKAIAAFLTPSDFAALLNESDLPQYTEHTKTKMRQLKSELARTRAQGYSINDEETVTGAFLVGTPLFDRNGIVCGSLSVNTPTARCSTERRQLLIEAVIRTGKTISKDLADAGFMHPVLH